MNGIGGVGLAGKLKIGGVAAGEAQGAADAQGTGLSVKKTEAAASKSVTQSQQASEAANKNVAQNFESTLMRRLTKARNEAEADEKTPEELEAMMGSIMDTVKEVKKEFGNETANQLMAEILTGTEKGVSGDRIAGAVSTVLKGIKNSNNAVINKSDVTADELAKAEELNKKLESFVGFLNKGDADEEGGSLNSALNSYFGFSKMAEDDQKNFGDDFAWLSANQIRANEQSTGQSQQCGITVEEFGRENLAELVDFLRNDLGDEKAAQYIETLGDEDDIFDAVDQLCQTFREDSQEVGGVNAETGEIVLNHLEGQGIEKMQKLGQFLNHNMVDKVNEVIRTNDDVRQRFLTEAGVAPEDAGSVPEGFGITAWPGEFGGRVDPAGFSPVSTNRRFGMDDMTGSTGMSRSIESMSGWGDFNRLMGDLQPDKKGQYQAGASSLDAKYNEAKKAYETSLTYEEGSAERLKAEAELSRLMADAMPHNRDLYLSKAARYEAEYETAMAAYGIDQPTSPGSLVKAVR
ncbi:hypothetical protein C4J81_18980 (plasmid) [Deltaproteobacteria bacterium Smac51]|nr:hypothetical protein C4J81_18980 [Deltaproteobacteria bacterium Smac51]